MIVDARGLDCNDSFRRISNIISDSESTSCEISVLVDSEKNDQLIRGFAQIVLGCDVQTEEMHNLYVIRIAGHPCMTQESGEKSLDATSAVAIQK
jgi:hypothetical protein